MLYTVGGDEGDWSSCHILTMKLKNINTIIPIYYNIGNIYSLLL